MASDVFGIPLGALALLIGGLALAGYALVQYDRARAIRRWPGVRGVVYAARVLAEKSTDPVGADGIDGAVTVVYRPEVRYEYEVGGRQYAANRRRFVELSTSLRRAAEGVVARYPEGRVVTVYYNPDDPRDAVLERAGVVGWTAALIGLGLFAAIGGGAWLVVFS